MSDADLAILRTLRDAEFSARLAMYAEPIIIDGFVNTDETLRAAWDKANAAWEGVARQAASTLLDEVIRLRSLGG